MWNYNLEKDQKKKCYTVKWINKHNTNLHILRIIMPGENFEIED